MKHSFALYALFLPFLVLIAAACGTSEEAAELPGPNDIVNVDEMPVLKDLAPPTYPKEARAKEIEGMVVVRALVGRNGRVVEAFVEVESDPLLGNAALEVVKKAIFKPAEQAGKPIAVWVEIPMRFSLDGGTEVIKGITDTM